jgi:hypothetical protein
MRRDWLWIAVWVLVIMGYAALGTAGVSEEEMCVPMGEITLSIPETVEAQRSPVEFPHQQHFQFACQRCHHTWKGDANITGCQTSGCHDLSQSPLKAKEQAEPSVPAIRYYKSAYHSACIGCHKQIKANNQKLEMSLGELAETLPAVGPTGCIGCHPKE